MSEHAVSEEVVDEASDFHPDIKSILKKKGYKFLGNGVDQMAFLEPGTGLVLKVFGTSDDTRNNSFSWDHKMFFRWAKFCMKHADNPFLPKFYGHESFVYKGRTYLQIRMEKLQSDSQMQLGVSGLGDRVQEAMGTNIDPRKEFIADAKYYPNWQALIEKIGKVKLTLLTNTLKKLIAIGDRSGWTWDLHEGNIMCRKDGFPVIVDPWHLGW